MLFWLSLFPFATDWMGKNYFEANPAAVYGLVLFMAAVAFKIMVHCVIQSEGKDSNIGKVYSKDKRMNLSLLLYFTGVVVSFFSPIISLLIYLGVALMWIVPDPRIEKTLKE